MKQEPIPKKQFSGTWAPAILHELVESGELPALGAWLAMIINCYAKGKKGCFASNEYLASKIHKCEATVKELLRKLETNQLLKSTWVGKMRFLSIRWEGTKSKRRVSYKADAKSRRVENYPSKSRRIENYPSDGLKTTRLEGDETGREPNESPGGYDVGKVPNSNSLKEKKRGAITLPSHQERNHPKMDNPGSANRHPLVSQHMNAAQLLRRLARAVNNRSLKGSDRKNAEHLRLLQEHDGQVYLPTLKEYFGTKVADLRARGVPVSFSIAWFRHNFDFVQDKLHAARGKREEVLGI